MDPIAKKQIESIVFNGLVEVYEFEILPGSIIRIPQDEGLIDVMISQPIRAAASKTVHIEGTICSNKNEENKL